MIIVVSPAKSLDLKPSNRNLEHSQPLFKEQITKITNQLKHYEPEEFEKLMKISEKLAQGVFDMYNSFNSKDYNLSNSKEAIFTFSGDVYKGLDATTLNDKTIKYAQEHLLMLSGLYGLIRPLDLIQPYRLEMGTKIKVNDQILHKFWQQQITPKLNRLFDNHDNKTLINLASKEYSQSIDKKNLKANWLDINFKENKNGIFKTIGIHAKKARGLMSRYILENRINNSEDLKKFNIENYTFNTQLSTDNYFCFTR